MKWKMIVVAVVVLVLFLGVAVGGLVMLHYDLASVRNDLATLHDDLAEAKASLANTGTDLSAIKTSVGSKSINPALSTGLTGDLQAINTELKNMNNPLHFNSIAQQLSAIKQDVDFIRLNGLP